MLFKSLKTAMKIFINNHFRIRVLRLLILYFILFFSGKITGQGLVAYYPFNGNANDATGNGHNGQLFNGIQLASDRFGNPNSAYYFDGIDDYIKVIDNGAFSTPQFSLAIWFQTESNALQNLVGKRDFLTSAGSGGSQYQFFINYPPFPGIGSNIVSNTSTCSNSSTSSYINTGNIICTNKWYFAVITFDGNRHRIYIDGVLVRDIPAGFTGMLACNSDLRFGNWWNLDLISFKGRMDDICWYNRAISQSEVDSIFNNFTSPTSPVEFSFSQDACDPLKINFINNTSGIQSGTWYFGDGNTSSITNPVHTYLSPGAYYVKLITTNNAGCTDSIIKSISVDISFADIIVNRDTTICSGASVQLNTNSNSDFCWLVTQFLNNSGISNPIATPKQTTTYYFNSKELGPNLVTNGNFSDGNSGFISEYSYATPNTTEGQIYVGTNPTSWNPSLGTCTDHTGNSGNMLLVNGASQSNVKIWKQTITVMANTTYEFSAWIQSLGNSNPAQLQFSINGIQVGRIFTAGPVCTWQRYSTFWNSGVATNAVISIDNKNTIVMGNDFALDDIGFAKTILRRDSVIISVLRPPTILASNDTSICVGQNVQLLANGASNFTWFPVVGLSNPNISNPIATPTTTTQYIVSGFDDPGCIKYDTVLVTVTPLPVFGINPSTQNLCIGDNFTINASGADNYSWFTSTQINLSSNSQLSGIATNSETYYVAMNENTCNFTDTLSALINSYSRPVITIMKSNDIDCTTPQAQLIATATGGSNYQWFPISNISNANIANPLVSPETDTWYSVTVTNGGGGCANKDSILVKSDLSKGTASFFVPNAFTPNLDGLNDCFGVKYWGITTEFEFSIYNRWGELVFITKDKTKCWDGIFKGVKQPSGVFVYQIKAKSPCSNESIYKKGTVVLIR